MMKLKKAVTNLQPKAKTQRAHCWPIGLVQFLSFSSFMDDMRKNAGVFKIQSHKKKNWQQNATKYGHIIYLIIL